MARTMDVREAANVFKIAEVTLYQQHQRDRDYGRHFKKVDGRLMADPQDLFDEALRQAEEALKSRHKKIGVRFSDAEMKELQRVAGPTPLATYIRQTVTKGWENAN